MVADSIISKITRKYKNGIACDSLLALTLSSTGALSSGGMPIIVGGAVPSSGISD